MQLLWERNHTNLSPSLLSAINQSTLPLPELPQSPRLIEQIYRRQHGSTLHHFHLQITSKSVFFFFLFHIMRFQKRFPCVIQLLFSNRKPLKKIQEHPSTVDWENDHYMAMEEHWTENRETPKVRLLVDGKIDSHLSFLALHHIIRTNCELSQA